MNEDLFLVDHHVHTIYSGHSGPGMTIGRIIHEAQSHGLTRIVILEHAPGIGADVREGVLAGTHKARDTLRAHLDAILEERDLWTDRTPMRVLVGAEVDPDPVHMNGDLLLDDLAGMDLVLAGFHYLPGARGLWFDAVTWTDDQRTAMYAEWFPWAMRVAANPQVDVIAHPGLALARAGGIDRFSGRVLQDFEKLFQVCARHGTAIELNESLRAKFSPAQAHSYEDLLALARDTGVALSVASDAHALAQLGRYRWVRGLVSRLGLTEEHMIHPRAQRRREARA